MQGRFAGAWQTLPQFRTTLAAGPLQRPGDRSNTERFSELIDSYPALFARTPFMPVLGNHDRQIMYRLLQPPAEPIYDLEATAFRRWLRAEIQRQPFA